MTDPNHDIVPTLRMFDGLITGQAADEIERLRGLLPRAQPDPAMAGDEWLQKLGWLINSARQLDFDRAKGIPPFSVKKPNLYVYEPEPEPWEQVAEHARQRVQPAIVTVPDMASAVVNDACRKFVETMPHHLSAQIFNDLRPALYAAICHVLATSTQNQTN